MNTPKAENRWERILSIEDVDIWRGTLDGPPGKLAELASTLSSEEQKRARQYHHTREHSRFANRRAILRDILSRYSGIPSHELRINVTATGKPILMNSRAPIHFNMAHSRGIALYAISASGPVGVDIEWVDPNADAMAIAGSHFAPDEIARLLSAREQERGNLFFRIWTAKEAFLKGTGLGLTSGLDRVVVEFDSATPTHICRAYYSDTPSSEAWSVFELPQDSQFVATLAVAPRKN